MIRFPVLQHLRVENYGLFPGYPTGSGINWPFPKGLTLIAGINGLGKTTLLTMILRAFTGPFDLTGDGAPASLGVIVPEAATELRGRALTFFAQRVADVSEATVVMSAKFGEVQLTLKRKLSDLSLLALSVDGVSEDLPSTKGDRERLAQLRICELMGVGGFVDVLLLLHHVILFHEDRPGALWDQNAQRHVLRALFLETADAQEVARLERQVQSADSQARNVHARITATERDLAVARRRESGSEGVVAQLEADQKLMDAELAEIGRLDAKLVQLDESRQQARLELERAKIEREDTSGAIERLKYEALLNLFPTMDDAARLVISRLMTDGKCLVCKADAPVKQAELEAAVADGVCPACGAPPKMHKNVQPKHVFEQAKLDQARQRLEVAKREESARLDEVERQGAAYKEGLDRLVALRRSVDERRQRHKRLRAQLPQTTTSTQFENALEALNAQHAEWLAKRASVFAELRALLESKQDRITSRSTDLMEAFSVLTRELLAEDARLAPVSNFPQYLQAPGKAEDRLKVPAYVAEMTSADKSGFVRRNTSSDVSESQRELIDLAFRLALVKTGAGGGGCTFVMETPEASLDGVAMERVGKALNHFADHNDNRLVVTSNLSNSGLITALFGGETADSSEVAAREARVINLLKVAKPNRALELEGPQYERLLAEALSGQAS